MKNSKNNTLLPKLNSVWKEHVEEKVKVVKNLQEEGGKSFIYFTDTHGDYAHHDKYGATLIEYIRKALGINTVIYGGDPYALGNSREEAQELLRDFSIDEFFGVQKETALYAVGNHESNICFARGREDFYESLIPDTAVFEDTVGQSLKFGTKLVFDQNGIKAVEKLRFRKIKGFTQAELKEQAFADVKMHYFYDDDDIKIRYIIFNTGSMGVAQCALYGGLEGGLGWTSYCLLELGWLIEILQSTPDEYGVVVAGHMLANDYAVGETNWTTNEFKEHIDGALVGYVQENINSILSLYKLGKSGEYRVVCDERGADDDTFYNIKVMASSANCATLDGDSLVLKYNFSKKKGKDKTVVFFTGHSHCDRSWISGFDSKTGQYASYRCYPDDRFSFDIDGGVLGIMTSCDCQQQLDVSDKFDVISATDTANIIDVVTIMPNGAVHCTRIGAGRCRSFNAYR